MIPPYMQFLADLTEPQVRALSSQAGLATWNTDVVQKLRYLLLSNETAKNIYETVYVPAPKTENELCET